MSLAEIDPALWRQLSTYLDEALDLEGRERENWLTELAASKPAIAATLRELIAEREALNSRRFLERSPLTEIARKAVLRSPAGRSLNAFSIDRLLEHCAKHRISAELVRYLNRERVEARRPTLAYRVRKFVARYLLRTTVQRLNP